MMTSRYGRKVFASRGELHRELYREPAALYAEVGPDWLVESPCCDPEVDNRVGFTRAPDPFVMFSVCGADNA